MKTATLHLERAIGLHTLIGFGVALALTASSDQACATTLGNLAASASLFATVAMFLVLKGWPAYFGVGGLSTAAGLLALAMVAALLWRSREAGNVRRAVVSTPACDPGPVLQLSQSADVVLPAGVDLTLLLTDLCRHFVRLQAAWDAVEHEAMRAMTTPDMLAELRAELASCAVASNHTEVVTLHARLLAFDDLADAHVVCVEFSGLIRESADQGAAPFRELWMSTRSKNEQSGWRLARHQALS